MTAPAAPVKKIDMIRAALNAGHEVPAAAVAWIRDTYGVDMKTTQFSSAKSQMRMREASDRGRVRAPRRSRVGDVPAVVRDLVPRPPGAPARVERPESTATTGLASDIETLRTMIARHGVDEVRRLVEVLGR